MNFYKKGNMQMKGSDMKKESLFRYHLRFQLPPGKHVAKDARMLAEFCKLHGIEEVVLFVAAGAGWHAAILSLKEENLWFNTIKQAKTILNKAGIVVSLNLLTIGQFDAGRSFPKDRGTFQPCVSPLGEKSKACASYADPNWRKYVGHLYGRFARLNFRVIWLEDDFRYHNHYPLTWGCGFEPEIIKRFSNKINRRVTRQELVKAFLKKGPPHPWRLLLMATWQDVQVEAAETIARAVRDNTPGDTCLGLMSSVPSIHAVEGRDWTRLLKALTINGKVAHRPNFADYGESVGRTKTRSMMALDLQRNFNPAYCEVAPEIERCPGTRWGKSNAHYWADMVFDMMFAPDALLIDGLFPNSGSAVNESPESGEFLDKSRPALKWVAGRFSKEMSTCGVGLPWREDAQARIHMADGQSMTGLNFEINTIADALLPGNLLLRYGVPVAMRTQNINAVFGNLAWSFSDDEIRKMLSGGLLLNGVSASILCQRGYSKEIGVDAEKPMGRDEALYVLEKVVFADIGVSVGFLMDVEWQPRMVRLCPLAGAVEWTTILAAEGKHFGAGLVVYKNSMGGRVVSWAACDTERIPQSNQGQALIQQAVMFLGGGRFPSARVTGGEHLLPIHFQGDNRHLVVVFNGSPDPAHPNVHLPISPKHPIEVTVLRPLDRPVQAKIHVQREGAGCVVTSAAEVPYLGFWVAEWRSI